MNIEELKTTSTIELVELWSQALIANNQSFINIYAYELAVRIWVPNKEQTFEDLLGEFGYKKIEKDNEKKKIK